MFQEKVKTDALTGIRAIAAYLVFFHHYPLRTQTTGKFLGNLCYDLHVGVGIFFVLSGFLISYNYYEKAQIKGKWIFSYYKSRFARIYPLYFLVAIITLINSHTTDMFQWFIQIMLFKGFFDSFKFIGVGQAWTLCVEMLFYISAPFILYYVKNKKSLILPTIATYACGLSLLLVGKALNWNGFFGNHRFVIVYTFFGRCFEFYIGIYLATLIKEKVKLYNILSKIKFKTYIGITFFSLLVIYMNSFISSEYSQGLHHPAGMIINNILLPIATATILFGLVTEKSIVETVLSSKLLTLLGKSSYAFYLIHIGVISSVIVSYYNSSKVIYFIIINLLSIAMFYLIEDPCRRLINNFSFSANFKNMVRLKSANS